MVRLNKIYTRTGDRGTTGLSDGSRVPKFSQRINAIGQIDETNSCIGFARLLAENQAGQYLARIQNDLFDLGADLSMPGDEDDDCLRIRVSQVERLEREIDTLNAPLSALHSFVLPGGTELAARLHLARSVARRAERAIVQLATAERVTPEVLRYINRLSDHLFVMARVANNQGEGDVLWVPGGNHQL